MLLPILYSFRRCPYAMRARMTLCAASITVDLREVFLREKPEEMLYLSAKGAVPVLAFDEMVLEQSLDIMYWALDQSDPEGWLRKDLAEQTQALIDKNDGCFKTHLDHYKYSDRYPAESQQHYREQGEEFLALLEANLQQHSYLLADTPTLVDIAIFPFIRQFAFVDKDWFDGSQYQRLQQWLKYFLESPLFLQSMVKQPPWRTGDQPRYFPTDPHA